MALDNSKLISDIEREVSIRENLGRFLPPHVVDNIIETNGENSISKSGTQLEGTILFADIRGFTQLSEVSSPQEIVDLLNDFFERLVQIVFKYDGIVDKFIGDCLMASWGTLSHHTNPERNAVNAALEFQIAVDEMNKERINLNKKPITIGIGINTGPLVAGYIGSSQRLEYTCIGDTVNTSSRICSLANENEVLISESTLERVSDEFAVEYIGDKMFKGKKQAIRVYQVHAL